MNADSLFQPIALGTLELPNRLIMTTVKLGYGTKEGQVTECHIALYVRRAKGGVGLITTEHAEEILEIFDWTGLGVEFHPISLGRLKSLLVACAANGGESVSQ